MSDHAGHAPQRALISFASGALFGVGLALSHMTDPLRVLGFLDVAGAWEPRLVAVIAGAVLVSALVFALAQRHGKPERKSVAEGKSVSGRVGIGGRPCIKKKKRRDERDSK